MRQDLEQALADVLPQLQAITPQRVGRRWQDEGICALTFPKSAASDGHAGVWKLYVERRKHPRA
jgi:hypothetical protein